MPVTTTIPQPKPLPEKAEWPLGTYKAGFVTFDDFAKENFVPGMPTVFTKKEVRKAMLIYTPDKEKDSVIKIWRVMMRFMGDMVDYRQDYEQRAGHKSYQPEMGSVMTRLCRILGTAQKDNPFGPQISQAEPMPDIPMQTLPYKPRRGTLKRLKDTIAQRILGKGRKTVFHLLPLEETLRTQLERVQFIAGYGILRPRLRDEIYCALCRQLRHNEFKESIKRGWLLFNVIAGCFPPSERCLDAILHFLDSGPKIHAATAKALLLRTMKNGNRLHPPCSLELDAATERRPLELEVHLADKIEILPIPVDGASTAAEVCDAAYRCLGLRNSFGFHLFMTTRNKISSLGCGNDHVLDAVSQVEQITRDHAFKDEKATWRIYLRKEVFEPWEDFTLDHKATNLIYEQIKYGAINHDYEFAEEEDLNIFFAKVYYIEHGSTMVKERLKESLVTPFVQSRPDFDELTERRVFDEIQDNTEAISSQFHLLYTEDDLSTKPNSFTVKIDIVTKACQYWLRHFARVYDAGAILHSAHDQESRDEPASGSAMEGVCFISVHSGGVSLLSDTHLVLYDVAYEEILQLSQENMSSDTSAPPALVFTLLGDRIIECFTADMEDIIDLVSYMLTGLNDRSTHAVAVVNHMSSKTDDLDLQKGDLILLDQSAGMTLEGQRKGQQPLLYSGLNERTGQHGIIESDFIHVVPTMEKPDSKILDLYRDHSA